MDLADYAILIGDALRRNETVVFAAHCSIRYSGRAESNLDHGDRVIIIKGDKAVLVHQPHGTAPINYMKPGSAVTLSLDDKKLTLLASNAALKESIQAEIERIVFFNSGHLQDGQVIRVAGTEEDMHEMLYANPDMIEKDFKPASREEQTTYGFIDVFGTDKDGNVVVVECKRYCADLSAVTQLRRYVEKIMISKGISGVRGILCAPKITENAKRMLEDWGYSFKEVRPPNYLEQHTRKQARLDGF